LKRAVVTCAAPGSGGQPRRRGTGGSREWVWKSARRSMAPVAKDWYDGITIETHAQWAVARRALGQALTLSERVELGAMVSHGELASAGYWLAAPGE
jgi:hypothetical protein